MTFSMLKVIEKEERFLRQKEHSEEKVDLAQLVHLYMEDVVETNLFEKKGEY